MDLVVLRKVSFRMPTSPPSYAAAAADRAPPARPAEPVVDHFKKIDCRTCVKPFSPSMKQFQKFEEQKIPLPDECPKCKGQNHAQNTKLQQTNLSIKIKCTNCCIRSSSMDWRCNCGVVWHTCQRHAPKAASNKAGENHTIVASKASKRPLLSASSIEQLLDDDLKRESKAAKKQPEKPSKKQQPEKPSKSGGKSSEKAKTAKQSKKENTKTTKAAETKAKKAAAGGKGSNPMPSSSSGSTRGSNSRKKVARKATSSRKGNLTCELLDMLLSDSDNEFSASANDEDSSDENWK